MIAGTRIDFLKVDAARFNALRDEWRGAAASCALSRSALRVANILPTFVSREYGYAFPTNEQLTDQIKKSVDTVKLGLAGLEDAGLIQRDTKVKRDDKGEAAGRERRIYLCIPTVRSDRTVAQGEGAKAPEVKGQNQHGSEGGKSSEVKGQEVKVHAEVKGQKPRGEGAPVPPYILDRITPDLKIGSGGRKVSTPASARENPYPKPSAFGDDFAFLDAFDRFVLEMTPGGEIGAGELERVTREAFDQATSSDSSFMPFFWADVCGLRTEQTAEWFRYRAGALVHRRAA